MILNDLEVLEKDKSGKYDLNLLTWDIPEGTNFGTYEVQKGEESRIDLVCEDKRKIVWYRNLIKDTFDNIEETVGVSSFTNGLDAYYYEKNSSK